MLAAPHGIKHVFVSGVETVCGEETTDAHPGRVLRSGRVDMHGQCQPGPFDVRRQSMVAALRLSRGGK